MKRIEQFEAVVKGNNEKQSEILADCLNNIHSQQKENESLCKSLKNGMKDSEKRISTDVSKLVQKIESKMISQQKESCAKIKQLIETHSNDVCQAVTSDCLQRQDLDKWAATLENSLRKGFTDLLHFLDQNIEMKVKANKEQDGLKKQVKSAGTITEDLFLQRRSNSSGHLRSFDEIARPPNSHSSCNNLYYQSGTSDGIKKRDEITRAISAINIHQHPNKNVPPQTGRSNPYMMPGYPQADPNVLSRKVVNNGNVSSIQRTAYNGAHIDRNSYSGDRNSLQNSASLVVAPFVSPFRQAEQRFPYKMGPSPCAVVVPQKQSTAGQTFTGKENKAGSQIMSPSMTKAKGKKRKRCAYSKKKKSSSHKKCAIEGLPAFNKSPLPKSSRSQRTALQNTYSEPSRQASGPYNNQDYKSEKTNLTSQGLKAQERYKNSKATEAFDPYSFDEPDPKDYPANPLVKGCTPAVFARPQTRSKSGFFTGKEKIIGPPATPKIAKGSESPQSSPSVSVLNMTFQRKVRTPSRGLSSRVRPQNSSCYRFPSINWQMNMDTSSPRTLLSDM
ncbi:hypothetical protein EGW08_004255 [Elysia chlorotica]|uniref:Uncharacterized protein n=1 Tax=Elysia chlorotica TaxID=188477 RepID=A0A3S1HX95_ELYCH|nr:hypothetical protein EGW08_004255 [Elysia chlorotica]